MIAEMVSSMKDVAKLDVELSVEERNLLSVGYKNVIGARRASWRIMSSIEQKVRLSISALVCDHAFTLLLPEWFLTNVLCLMVQEENKGNEENVKRIKEYRAVIEKELSEICQDILSTIDSNLIPSSSTGESKVFYYKM